MIMNVKSDFFLCFRAKKFVGEKNLKFSVAVFFVISFSSTPHDEVERQASGDLEEEEE